MKASVFASMVVNLFLIVDPIGCIPLFAAITRSDTPARRRAMILRASIIAFLVLAFFALAGRFVLEHFGIGIPAVRIAGGILMFMIGMEMLFGRVSRTETTEPEEKEAAVKEDVSVTPLAIPLLAGPGAIAAIVLFSGTVQGIEGSLYLTAAIAIVMAASWLLLATTDSILRVLGQIGIKVVARVMGLLLLFVATQFVIDGLLALGILAGPPGSHELRE